MIPVSVQTKIPGPRSQEIVERALRVIAKAQYIGLYGVSLTHGEGVYITDADNNTYIDFLSGASVTNVGYGRRELVEIYSASAQKIQHSCFPYSPNDESVRFANKLIETTPGQFEKQVLFGLSGSDSIDAAVKIARKYTRRPRILSFRGGYHGATGFSFSANGFEGLHDGLFIDHEFVRVDFPRNSEAAKKSLDEIYQLVRQGDVAALIVEGVQGDGGNVVPPPDFHLQLIDLLHRYGCVYIVDEIQSGVGRSGAWWECQTFDVTPDILCAGKALTGGYAPMSACVARAEMAQTLEKAQHLFSYTGHSPSAAVGSKVLEIIEGEKLRENAAARGEQLRIGLQKLVDLYPFAKEVRGRGLQIGFEVFDESTGTPLGGLFAFRCVEKGIYPGYFGPKNEVMRLHPPLTISPEEMAYAIHVIASVAEEWANHTFPSETVQRYFANKVGLGSD